jgi:hypothetical protein
LGEVSLHDKKTEMKNTCETENKPKTFNELIRSSNFRKSAIAVLIGGILGYLYYHFIGCTSGTCSITANPVSSVIFGGVFGLFIVNRPCKTC